jgi:hypothetical protein
MLYLMLLDGSMKETPRRRIPDTSSLNKNPRISWEIRRGRGGGVSVRPKARGLVHHSVPPSWQEESDLAEPVFLNVYGAQESPPRNEFRQPTKPGGPVR